MRKLIMASALSCLLAGAATAQDKNHDAKDNHQDSKDKNYETITGNGNLVNRDVQVSSFVALKASGVYELQLSQGSKESVRIEADENLQELFQVRNEGQTLVIDMKKLENTNNYKSRNKVKIYVTFRNISRLEVSTVGNVQSEDELSFDDFDLKTSSVGNVNLQFTAGKVDIVNSSVGNIKLSGKANNAVVRNSGVGSLQAGSFEVQNMNIENNGIGSAEVNAARELKVSDNHLGKVKNRGAAPVRKINKVEI
jgi:hypothetical protein